MMSLTKYLNSTPKSELIQIAVPNNVHKDFSQFVTQYKPQTTVQNEDISVENLPFFTETIASLFHTVFVPATAHTEAGYGSGNIQLVKLNRDGGTYYLELYGARQARAVYAINDATVEFSGTSMQLSSGNGLTLSVNKSGDFYDFTGQKIELWQFSLFKNSSVVFRYHTIQLTM